MPPVHVDPLLHEHVEAMVAIALAPARTLDARALTARLSADPDQVAGVLDALAAAGLLRRASADGSGPPAYRLARSPEAIGLDEIAALAARRDRRAAATGEATPAAVGARSVDAALRRQVQQVLARFTLADVLAAPGPLWAGSAASAGAASARQPMPNHRLARPDGPSRLGVTVDRLWALVEAGDVPVVIDVRDTPEAGQPAPPWAHWIALEGLAAHAERWAPDTRIVTVCRTGIRSLVAASYLQWRGYRRAHHLIGGLAAWQRGKS